MPTPLRLSESAERKGAKVFLKPNLLLNPYNLDWGIEPTGKGYGLFARLRDLNKTKEVRHANTRAE